MTTKLIVLACLLTVSQAHFNDIERPYESFRIIGGNNAHSGEFPHMVALGRGWSRNFRSFCGGSIISEQWVLTAAHCGELMYLEWFTYGVIAGTYDIDNYEKSMQWVKVASVFIHENYKLDADGPEDIALIKLKRKLKFNKKVAPLNLPKKDTEPTGPVILSGWGKIEDSKEPSLLQKINLEIVDRKTCNQALVEVYGKRNITITNDRVRDMEICSGPLNSGLSGCYGDSGSALIRNDENGKIEAVGIAAWIVRPCGTIGAPTVYVKVSSFIDWIDNIIAKNSNYTDGN